jgi:hypothetical protein
MGADLTVFAVRISAGFLVRSARLDRISYP